MSYINGSDLLIKVGEKAIGHCTSHTLTFNSETKDRAVKPLATEKKAAGLWKDKTVTGLNISISAEGLRFASETEGGFDELSKLWGAGTAVKVVAFEREKDAAAYLEGMFVITSLEETTPAGDDATYSISLENAGVPTKYPGMTPASDA